MGDRNKKHPGATLNFHEIFYSVIDIEGHLLYVEVFEPPRVTLSNKKVVKSGLALEFKAP